MFDWVFFFDVLGILGEGMIFGVYLLLHRQKVSASGYSYLSINFVGSLLILPSLYIEGSNMLFLIQLGWLAVSGSGLCYKFAQAMRQNALRQTPTVYKAKKPQQFRPEQKAA